MKEFAQPREVIGLVILVAMCCNLGDRRSGDLSTSIWARSFWRRSATPNETTAGRFRALAKIFDDSFASNCFELVDRTSSSRIRVVWLAGSGSGSAFSALAY